jgi:hypothetical protein
VLGFGLLLSGSADDFSRAYPWIGLGIWTVSIAVATGAVWPAEAAVQNLLAAGPTEGARELVDKHCRTIERSSIALVVCFLGAFVVMVGHV